MLLLVAPAVGAAKAAELDGPLLALVDEYVELARMTRQTVEQMTETEGRVYHGVRVADLFMDRYDAQKLIELEIAARPARTPEGLKAKSRAVVWMLGGDDRPLLRPGQADALLGSLLTDLVGSAAA